MIKARSPILAELVNINKSFAAGIFTNLQVGWFDRPIIEKEKLLNFSINTGGYCTLYKDKQIAYHRIILQAPSKMVVDHLNHDRIDNRLSNLRLCTSSENNRNTIEYISGSTYKGVYRNASSHDYLAVIFILDKVFILGAFNHELDAAKAYDYGMLNFYQSRNLDTWLNFYPESLEVEVEVGVSLDEILLLSRIYRCSKKLINWNESSRIKSMTSIVNLLTRTYELEHISTYQRDHSQSTRS